MKISLRPTYITYMGVLVSFYLFSTLGCRSSTEEIVQNYPSGEISRRHIEVNGKKEGEMTEYYKDGKVKGVRLFENDIQVGKAVFYYPSGKIQEVQYYEQGKMNGGDTVFYETGQPQFLRTFNKGALDGYIRKWGQDGSIVYEAKYSNDTLVEVKGEAIHPDTLLRK
jgi:antitoxin component YwqK of YwqJK toxin-antitoxin module